MTRVAALRKLLAIEPLFQDEVYEQMGGDRATVTQAIIALTRAGELLPRYAPTFRSRYRLTPAAKAGVFLNGVFPKEPMAPIKVAVPLRTVAGLNAREHHMVRARRVKKERHAIAWALNGKPMPPATMPVVVLLTRMSPGNGLDNDNLQGALKAVRDQVADWLKRDDADPSITWQYAQRRAPWGVEVMVFEGAVE